MDEQFPAEEYAGPAVVSTGSTGGAPGPTDEGVRVDVTLRGHFEPLDGRFHWYGRLAADQAVGRWQSGATVVITTPGGSAAGRLSDLDPWGRFRVSGTGRPPF